MTTRRAAPCAGTPAAASAPRPPPPDRRPATPATRCHPDRGVPHRERRRRPRVRARPRRRRRTARQPPRVCAANAARTLIRCTGLWCAHRRPHRPPRIQRRDRRVRPERQRHPDPVHRTRSGSTPATGPRPAAARTCRARRPTAGRTPAARWPPPRTRRARAIIALSSDLDVLDAVPAGPQPIQPDRRRGRREPGQHRRDRRVADRVEPALHPVRARSRPGASRDLLGGRGTRGRTTRRPSR